MSELSREETWHHLVRYLRLSRGRDQFLIVSRTNSCDYSIKTELLWIMTTSLYRKQWLILAGVSAVSIASLSFIFSSSISRITRQCTYFLQKQLVNANDSKELALLERIEKATEALVCDLNDFERKPERSSTEKKNILIEISTDIDYLFAKLDSIRGGELVKQQRKLKTQSLLSLARRFDALSKADDKLSSK
jgi:hypothetical protein